MFKLNSLNSLRALRHLHASQSAGVRALTTCSSLILKQWNPLLSLSVAVCLRTVAQSACRSKLLEQLRFQGLEFGILGILCEVSGEIWIPVKSVVKSLEYQNRKTSRSVKFCCRYAGLDCRMGRMKNNCRKAAMETRQQHIQVDLAASAPTKWETYAKTKAKPLLTL